MPNLGPVARRDGLLVQELGQEIILYDAKTLKAHSLNPAAALIWKLSDGSRTVSDLTALLVAQTGLPPEPAIVTDALEQLRAGNLLVNYSSTVAGPDLDRRELIKRIGVMAALLPVVLSITAPTPAMAQSGGQGPTGPTGTDDQQTDFNDLGATGPIGPTGI